MSDQAVSISNSNSNNVVKKSNAGRPLKFPSVELLEEKINQYFDKCDSRTKTIVVREGKNSHIEEVPDPEPYTLSGLAVFLDCDRDTLLNYSKRDEYFGTIKRAKARCLQDAERRLYEQFTPGIIFSMKNNYGWTDKQDLDISVGQKQVDLSNLSKDDIKRLALQAKDVPLLPDSE